MCSHHVISCAGPSWRPGLCSATQLQDQLSAHQQLQLGDAEQMQRRSSAQPTKSYAALNGLQIWLHVNLKYSGRLAELERPAK